MALTNQAYFSPTSEGLNIDVTVNTGSGNNRIVVGFGAQEISTLNLGSPTLNGTAPTGEIITQDNGQNRVTAHYWLDGDIPASSGTYTLSYTGPDINAVVAAYYAEGAKQIVPHDIQSEAATGTTPSFDINAVAGSTTFIMTACGTTGTYTAGTDQSILLSDTTIDRDRQIEYKTSDSSVTHTFSVSSVYASAAFSIEPLPDGVIGLDDTTGLGGTSYNTTNAQLLMDGYNTFTASADQEIISVGLHHIEPFPIDPGQIEVGVYDITSGVNGASLISSETISVPASAGRTMINLSSPAAIVSGNEYAVGWRIVDDYVAIPRSYENAACSNSNSDGSTALDSSFDDAGTSLNQRHAVFAEVYESTGGGSATVTITETNGAFGDTLNISTTNMSTLTTWQLEDSLGNTINITGSDTTAVIPALADEVNRLITGTVTLTVGDGTDTATDTFNLISPSGYASVKLAAGFDTDETTYLFNYGGTPAVGDEFHYLTSEVTLYDDGSWESSSSVTTTIYGVDATDGYMESFNLITGGVDGTSSLASDDSTFSGTGTITRKIGATSLESEIASLSGSGGLIRTGSGDFVSGDSSFSGSGTITRKINATDLDSQNSDLSGSGSKTIKGTSDLQSQISSLSGSGSKTIKASDLDAVASDSSLSGSGSRTVKGDSDLQAEQPTLEGEGQVFSSATGTGDLQSQDADLSATATKTVKINATALDTDNASMTATASRTIKGSGTLVSADSTINATGEGIVNGTAVLSVDVSTLSATGTKTIKVNADISSEDSTMSASGSKTVKVDGTISSGDSSLSASGNVFSFVTGSGDLQSQDASIIGFGTPTVIGNGVLEAQDADIDVTVQKTVKAGNLDMVASGGGLSVDVQLIHNGEAEFNSSSAFVDGAGSKTIKGSGSLVSEDASAEGSGKRVIATDVQLFSGDAELSGTGGGLTIGESELQSQNAVLNATGQKIVKGVGSLQSENSVFDADAKRTIKVFADIELESPSLDLVFERVIQGTGELQSQDADLNVNVQRVIVGSSAMDSGNAVLSGFQLDSNIDVPTRRKAYPGRSFAYIIDPSDKVQFEIDFNRILTSGEELLSIDVEIDEESKGYGVKFDDVYIPAKSPDKRSIIFTLMVDEAFREHAVYEENAHRVELEVTVTTTGNQSFQRTNSMKIKQL